MRYPFEEGDTYYTLEGIALKELMLLNSNGENPYIFEVVESTWDFVSEEMHDENPSKQYFKTREEAEARNITFDEFTDATEAMSNNSYQLQYFIKHNNDLN